MIAKEGRGVVVAIREPTMTILTDRVRSMMQGEHFTPALRDYGVGAQILLDLGVRELILLSNTERTIVALEGYGLSVVERRAISVPEKK
jgi:3,4-dihydroxy 2-butanone 4-phosphate synthase/GTP cyclohydrolase II